MKELDEVNSFHTFFLVYATLLSMKSHAEPHCIGWVEAELEQSWRDQVQPFGHPAVDSEVSL